MADWLCATCLTTPGLDGQPRDIADVPRAVTIIDGKALCAGCARDAMAT